MSGDELRSAPAEQPSAWFLPAGILIGFAGALCGIGGGIFAGPLLHATKKIALKRAAATAILVILATTTAATTTEFLRGDSELVWPVVLPLAAGALVGAELGFRISKRIDERTLKTLFAVILLVAGVRVLLFSSGLATADLFGPNATAAVAFAIGLVGGSLTPLLGIAGGVIMVPALFLALGHLGFGGARAAALAAGAVSALRSLWLHARAGNISYALGLPLAGGALFGAFFGVQAAHVPALAFGGRLLLGGILLAQSVRFWRELAASRAPRG
ncbi:MAG: sulfite exporter TauE/SafE family protein [Planctomycetota bacterium]